MQYGLAQWLAYLSDKRLPLLKRTRASVQSRIDQSQLSITQYAVPALFDGGFAAYIFQHVNTQRVSMGKSPLTTSGNALSHLGGAAFQSLLNDALLLESMNLHEKNQLGYLRVMEQACHAGLQAKDWAKQRGVLQPEETQLAASLQSLPEMMLWCYGDTAMREIEYLHYVKKQDYEKAADKVLGCGMRELGATLAFKWELPEMAVEGLRSRQDNFTLATGVSLAAELTRVVAQNWYGRQARDIIQRISKYKAKPEAEISRQLHLNAVNFTESMLGVGYAAPARLLPQLAADDFIDSQYIFHKKNADSMHRVKESEIDESVNVKERSRKEMAGKHKQEASKKQMPVKGRSGNARLVSNIKQQAVKKPGNSTVSVDNSQSEVPFRSNNDTITKASLAIEKTKIKKKTLQNKAVIGSNVTTEKKNRLPAVSRELGAAIKEFQLMVVQGKPAHELIEKAVKSSLLCGVQRCVFSVKVPDKGLLVSRYTAQVRENDAIKGLKISVNNPHVFTLLMEKNRSLFLNDSNRQKYWNSIPEEVKLATGARQFFAASIFANTHAMGLMYADKIKGELTQPEFTHFQGICRLLSKGIVQSALNKKK
ncbi:hypothetical protein MNBD_GAMMA11-1545 [hydrothermal vent metagenome]|uniref:HDOD domain-containing protein n=1 Tax=hydrothermal vent metagenome TaxID=652676 RepID=A0A3B0Y456_9ZZZZ